MDRSSPRRRTAGTLARGYNHDPDGMQGQRRSPVAPGHLPDTRYNPLHRRLVVLIDRRQTRWAVATVAVGVASVGLYLWLDRRSETPLTGGSRVGLWYGVAGSLLMIYAGLLSAHRLFPAAWW